ncbi:MAG: HlyD family efflux transporter periplasmic adaptor subunit [Planctomycetaceae bacterium]|jgi:biotin carboxyl carrier protein|nr:HlyD family efflux transporter periplasmic adaptor subunit [Planctomycetaceae bacterium]
MYNSLTIIALVPLMGPDVAQADLSQYQTNIAPNIKHAQPADEIPVLPKPLLTASKELDQSTKVVIANRAEPDIFPTTNSPTSPTTSPTINSNNSNSNSPTSNSPTTTIPVVPNELIVDGSLEVPKRNHIVLAAPCSAVLMSLKTTQDDKEINITEGMPVKKGQILGKFDDRTLQNQLRIDEAQLNVAIAAEKKIIEVEYAARSVQVAITKLNILKSTNNRHPDTIPAMEILLAEHERMQAEANLSLCKYSIEHERKEETNVRKQTVEATKTSIQIRQLVSPIDGIITKIERSEGEYAREGEPILEITQLDTLRAVCKVNTKHCPPNLLEGKNITVEVKKTNDDNETFTGKIVFVSPKVSMSNNEYDIYVEIKNQKIGNSWKLQPGSRIIGKFVP